MNGPMMPTHYERLGGAEKVRALVQRFYQLMDELPEAYGIRKLHPDDLHGSEEKLFKYLSGWTGQGYIFNNQSRGTVSYFYRIDRSVYIRDVAPDQVNREVNWNPIWSFKVC